MPAVINLWNRWALSVLLSLVGLSASAQTDAPGRAGRLADIAGEVSLYDIEQGQWTVALRNRPLTTGDRLATGRDGRAEVRVGSTTLRLGRDSEFELLRLDDERMRFHLHSGSLALRVRSREVAGDIDIETAEARLRPLRSGLFRIDRQDDTTLVSSWRGELRVESGPDTFDVPSGRRAELWREGPDRSLRHAWTNVPDDDFADWVLREDRLDERSASTRYVSPEMTGVEDLDRYGRWEQHPDYGAIWYPIEVAVDWAPYRFGHWAWVRPWGWTWVDDARWGFAPFHYGRWVSWRNRWCWVPGAIVPRPVFAPALVGWIGGPQVGFSLQFGGPSVSWVPLAPFEPYRPAYPVSPRHRDYHGSGFAPGRGHRPLPPPGGPSRYGNQGVPGGITVVPAEALNPRHPQPVHRRDRPDDPGANPQRPQPFVPPSGGHRPTMSPPRDRGTPDSGAPVSPPDRPAVDPGRPRPGADRPAAPHRPPADSPPPRPSAGDRPAPPLQPVMPAGPAGLPSTRPPAVTPPPPPARPPAVTPPPPAPVPDGPKAAPRGQPPAPEPRPAAAPKEREKAAEEVRGRGGEGRGSGRERQQQN